MHMSEELTTLVVDGTNKAISQIINTDGPLMSFAMVESPVGTRGSKDFPQGTTDDDLVALASTRGVQRYVLVSSGTVQNANGPAPVILIHAAERGDAKALMLAQAFSANRSPKFSEPEGQIQAVQQQDNPFRRAPFAISEDRTQNGVLLQEAFARFGRRLMGGAYQDENPRIMMAVLSVVDGEDAAEGSFQYVHTATDTQVVCECEYRNNVFVPTRVLQADVNGNQTPLTGELCDSIIASYDQ